MPAITFVQPDARRQTVEAREGASIMLTARENGIDGILGECGGFAACGTCHVYVASRDLDRLKPIEELEEQMLEATAAERFINSRLGCQIAMTAELDGVEVTIPSRQN